MWPRPKALCGQHVSLSPLTHKHTEGLAQAAQASDHVPAGCRVPRDFDMADEVSFALEQQADAKCISYTVQRPSGETLGMVKYSAIDRAHKRLEIGDIWLASPTEVELIETFLMMLSYGFEFAKAQTIQMRAQSNHTEHRAIIQSLGGQLDGTLRGERISRKGQPLNIAVYSILTSEWKAVRNELQLKLRTE